MEQVFIPDSVLVGFQNIIAEETEEKEIIGLMAYVTYKSGTKIKCNISWTAWSDPTLEPKTLVNKPQDRFMLKKVAHSCYTYKDRGIKYIVEDPRGFLFEITPQNLLYAIQHAGVNRDELLGDYVYAFQNSAMHLIPVNSELYKNAQNFTEMQRTVFPVEQMVPGFIYEAKDSTKFVFLGKYRWFSLRSSYNSHEGRTIERFSATEKWIMLSLRDFNDIGKLSADHLPERLYVQPWANISKVANKLTSVGADTFDKCLKILADDQHLHAAVRLVASPATLVWPDYNTSGNQLYPPTNNSLFIQNSEVPGQYHNIAIRRSSYQDWATVKDKDAVFAFNIQHNYTGGLKSSRDGLTMLPFTDNSRTGGNDYINKVPLTKQELETYGFVELNVELDNGKLVEFTKFIRSY